MIIKEPFEIAGELVLQMIPYMNTVEYFSLFIAMGCIFFCFSLMFADLIGFGYGFAKFVFETLVRLIKELISND